MRSIRAIFLSAVLAASIWAAPAQAQAPRDARGGEMALALDFLTLELAGWRLPDPVQECLDKLDLRLLEPGTFGASEMAVDPILLDGVGPHARILGIDGDPSDRRRRIVRFEWLIPTGGRIRAVADRFVMLLNDQQGEAAMMREPEQLVVRRECFGG
jgi:hypothetical protein